MKLAKPMFAPHTSAIERIWYFALRIICVLTLLYLILPVLAIVPLSFSSSTFLVYPIPGWSMHTSGRPFAHSSACRINGVPSAG